MKGTSFQKPLELRVEIDGESWAQGGQLKGVLTTKNHGPTAIPVEDLGVKLVYGKLKDVRAKDSEAIDIIASQIAPNKEIPAQSEMLFAWSFDLDPNFQVTEENVSPFILFGHGPISNQGHLQLKIIPQAAFSTVIEAVKVQYRFVLKSTRHSKGWTDFKMTPPTAKSFAALDWMTLGMRMKGETMELRYSFTPKKLAKPPGAPEEPKRDKKEHKQILEKSDYLTPSGRPNHIRIEACLREAMDLVENKINY